MESMDESCLKMMNLICSINIPASIRAAVLLKVPDILNKAGTMLSAMEISAQIPSSKSNAMAVSYLDRIMRFLVINGIFDESIQYSSSSGLIERRYGLNALSKHLVEDGNDESLAPAVLLFQGKESNLAWNCLHEAVLDGGEPFKKGNNGKSLFELGTEDPQMGRVFNSAISNYTKRIMRMVLETYDGFKDAKVLVDVGGGLGTTLRMITAKYPHVQGINFDLPKVVEQAAQQQSGVENVGGNMFESVPGGDMILLKWILHDWDDKRAIKILINCHKALPKSGKVVIMDSILPEQGSYSLVDKQVFVSDLNMLVCNGGKERSMNDFQKIVQAAGYKRLCIIPSSIDCISIIELHKV